MSPRIIPVQVDALTGWGEIPAGPWVDEPDAAKIICGDAPAVAARLGVYAWGGYLGFPEGHPTFGESYDNHYDDWPDVHGGWTFSDLNPRIDEIARMNGLWWIGFDCAHAGDLSPLLGLALSARFGEVYRTLEYVADELCRAAEAFS